MAWDSEVWAHGNLSFSFCSCCGCQWDPEHEEIKWQDLPHPACSLSHPTLGCAAVALVCTRSWLQTPGTLGDPEHWSPRAQCLLKALATVWELYLNLPFIWGSEALEGSFCCAGLPSDWGIIIINRQAPSPEIQKSNFPMQLEPVVPKLVREEWDTKGKCLQWQSKTSLFSKALSSKLSCTSAP